MRLILITLVFVAVGMYAGEPVAYAGDPIDGNEIRPYYTADPCHEVWSGDADVYEKNDCWWQLFLATNGWWENPW